MGLIEKYRNFGQSISDFLLSIGLEPIYVAALFILILTLSHWKYFKKWDELPIGQQRALKIYVFASIVAVIGAMMLFFGLF